MDSVSALILKEAGGEVKEPARLNPLVLAYVGDTVFDLYVRTQLVASHDAKVSALHFMSARRVCAAAQSKGAKAIFPELNQQEQAVFMRARNAKPHTIPKNADPEDYAYATALEAVLGYLYLSGEDERLFALCKSALQAEAVTDSPKPRPYKG